MTIRWSCILVLLARSATAQAPPGAVETAMRRVDYHVDSTLVMHMNVLRGTLEPLRLHEPVSFDDPHSFAINIDTAEITLSTTALSDLLNRYVFGYRGADLKHLHVETVGSQLKQSGRLHGLPFTILTSLSVMPNGELRLHPTSIHVLGIGAAGLMRTFGLSLQKLANVDSAHGVRIEGNDLLLTAAAMLPAPATRGHVVHAVAHDSTLWLWFAPQRKVPPLVVPNGGRGNFMFFNGASIHFGRLTMTPADLLVVDANPATPFDFWLARYLRQLVAGVSHTTPSSGLITTWPDFAAIHQQ